MTLNQFVNVFRNFATDHAQLKGSIFIGDGDGFAVGKSQNTPVLCVDIDPTVIKELTKIYKARIVCYGAPVSKDNHEAILEIQNDTEMICEDLIAVCNNISNSSLTFDIEISHYEQAMESNDLLTGSFFDIALEVFKPINICNIPTT